MITSEPSPQCKISLQFYYAFILYDIRRLIHTCTISSGGGGIPVHHSQVSCTNFSAQIGLRQKTFIRHFGFAQICGFCASPRFLLYSNFMNTKHGHFRAIFDELRQFCGVCFSQFFMFADVVFARRFKLLRFFYINCFI